MLNIECVFTSRVRNLEWVILWENVLLKHVYLKFFFPTKVAVRKFFEKIGGGIMFLIECVFYVFSGPVHI